MNEMIEALQKLVSFQSIAKEEGPEYPYGKEVCGAKEYVLELAKSFGMRGGSSADWNPVPPRRGAGGGWLDAGSLRG